MKGLQDLITRVWNTILGKSHTLIDSLENPEEQLKVFVHKMSDEIEDLTRSTTLAVADEKRLKMNLEQNLNQAAEWESKAIFALEQGKEELAKEALLKKADCEAQASNLKQEWKIQNEATIKLKTSLKLSKEKVEKAKRDYNILLAKYQTAKTTQNINKTINGSSIDSPTHLIESLQDKIFQIEAETEAELEMSGASVDLDSQFAELERAKTGADALEQLKLKMSKGKTPDEIDAKSSSSEFESDIDTLKKKVS